MMPTTEGGAAPPAGLSVPLKEPISPNRSIPLKLRKWLWKEKWQILALSVVVVGMTAFRLDQLLTVALPTGPDNYQDLYAARVWLGTAFPSPVSRADVFPVYPLFGLFPLVDGLGLSLGMDLAMAIVPALLAIPIYLLIRFAGASRFWSLFGGALTAISPAYSYILTWNGAENLSGILLFSLFLAFFVRAFRQPTRWNLVLTSVFFGLEAGDHYLSFVFMCGALAVATPLLILFRPDRRATARLMGYIWAGGILASLPFDYIVYTFTVNSTNLGASSGLLPSNYYLLGLYYGVGYTGNPPVPEFFILFACLGVISSVLACVVYARTTVTPLLLGMVVTAFALGYVDPGNWERGFFFLPLVFGVAIALSGDFISKQVVRLAEKSAGSGTRTISYRRSALVKSSVKRGVPLGLAALCCALFVVTAGVSQTVLHNGIEYYDFLTPGPDLNALNWLADNTPLDTRVFLAWPNLYEVEEGYSNRYDFSPALLNLEITKASYQEAYDADLVVMGQYVEGNSYLAVADNGPVSLGSPDILVADSIGWAPLFEGDLNETWLEVSQNGTPYELRLGSGSLQDKPSLTTTSSAAWQNLTYDWPSLGIEVTGMAHLSSEMVTLGWSASGGTVTGVNMTIGLTPNGFSGIDFDGLSPVANASDIVDGFTLNGARIALSLASTRGNLSQATLSSGWTDIRYSGAPELTFDFQGIAPVPLGAPYSIQTSSLLHDLGVSYMVTNYNFGFPDSGYVMYLRCSAPNGILGFTADRVFSDLQDSIFSLTPDQS